MDFFVVSFVGGFVGAYFMDVTEAILSRWHIRSGVTAAYIGRWAVGLGQGRFFHANIESSNPIKNEVRIGLWFHFIVGGGMVALAYPVVMTLLGFTGSSDHLFTSLIFGFATSIFPWFILMPSLGWGLFGLKGPAGSKPVLAPILSHIPYGLGIGLTLMAYYKMWN